MGEQQSNLFVFIDSIIVQRFSEKITDCSRKVTVEVYTKGKTSLKHLYLSVLDKIMLAYDSKDTSEMGELKSIMSDNEAYIVFISDNSKENNNPYLIPGKTKVSKKDMLPIEDLRKRVKDLLSSFDLPEDIGGKEYIKCELWLCYCTD